jgi:hypothetical protein
MKGTATSYTVIGALIITIMFTATFTVPDGNDQNTGFPMFSNKKLFKVFIITDALSFISSSTSVLVFLGILTCIMEKKIFHILAYKDDFRYFHSFLLYCNYDDRLLCWSFHYATWKIMNDSSCHLPH